MHVYDGFNWFFAAVTAMVIKTLGLPSSKRETHNKFKSFAKSMKSLPSVGSSAEWSNPGNLTSLMISPSSK
jgi:hypothetical protein